MKSESWHFPYEHMDLTDKAILAVGLCYGMQSVPSQVHPTHVWHALRTFPLKTAALICANVQNLWCNSRICN